MSELSRRMAEMNDSIIAVQITVNDRFTPAMMAVQSRLSLLHYTLYVAAFVRWPWWRRSLHIAFGRIPRVLPLPR